MAQSDAAPAQNTFNIANSSVGNITGSGPIYYNTADALKDASDDRDFKKTILFLAANPISTHPLNLGKEVREIEAGLQRSKHRDRFALKQRWAVRPKDLQRSLLDEQPSIVHFSGHGIGRAASERSAEGNREISLASRTEVNREGLVLEDTIGEPKLVDAAALSALFELFADSVECVVLNACYSERQAAAIAQHIPYVIGMKRAVTDDAAIEFSVGFYDALLAGKSVSRAFELGKVSIQLSGIPEHDLPVLLSATP